MPIVILVTIWMIFPFSALVLLSALQSVPDDLYGAARLDGDNSAALFRNVTLPSIAPSAAVLVLFVTIWSIRRFEVIWLLTGGGPQDATGTLGIDEFASSLVVSALPDTLANRSDSVELSQVEMVVDESVHSGGADRFRPVRFRADPCQAEGGGAAPVLVFHVIAEPLGNPEPPGGRR